MTSESLFVWKFTPVARPDEPAWQGRPVWADFRIVAANAGDAILLASRYDKQQRMRPSDRLQDWRQFRSGLEDPLLYRVDRFDVVDPQECPRGTVISNDPLVAAPQ